MNGDQIWGLHSSTTTPSSLTLPARIFDGNSCTYRMEHVEPHTDSEKHREGVVEARCGACFNRVSTAFLFRPFTCVYSPRPCRCDRASLATCVHLSTLSESNAATTWHEHWHQELDQGNNRLFETSDRVFFFSRFFPFPNLCPAL